MERFEFKADDSTTISCAKWIPENEPEALIQIVHGMNEHIGRYDETARFFVEKGYAVFGEDHRGHGLTGKGFQMGHFADKDGYLKVIEDNFTLLKLMKKEYPGKKLILYGHSMGSFISRNIAWKHGKEIDFLLISGSGNFSSWYIYSNFFLLSFFSLFKKQTDTLPFIHNIGMNDLNKCFEPRKTDYDWLSTDPSIAEEFQNDPLCKAINSIAFYKDLMSLMKSMQDKTNIEKIPKDLPVFIFSGSMDPVGKNGKTVKIAYENYKKSGLRNIKLKIFEGYRHELHKEPVKEQLFNEIISWTKSFSKNNLKTQK